MPTTDQLRPLSAIDLDGALDHITAAAVASVGLRSAAEADSLIAGILTMADEWAAGRLPLTEVRRLTTGQERFLAMRFTRPAPNSFRRMIDAIIDTSGGNGAPFVYRTKHGMLTEHDIRGAGGVITKSGESVVIRFSAGDQGAPKGRWG